MRRRKALVWATLASVVAHGFLVAMLRRAPLRHVLTHQERVAPVYTVELFEAPTPPPRSTVQGSSHRASPPTPTRAPRTSTPVASPANPADAPRKALVLTPSLDALGQPVSSELPGGRTLYPDDPMFSAEARAAESRARVTGRVESWAQDEIGARVADSGALPEYLANLDHALEQRLGHARGNAPSALGESGSAAAMARSYLRAADQYARTGNPGTAVPSAPTLTEKLQDRFGGQPSTLALRMMAQAADTFDGLKSSGGAVRLKLSIEQDTEGKVIAAAVVESSGNAPFDHFVLNVGRSALASAAPPPSWLLHGDRLRSLWLIEGWPKPPKSVRDGLAWAPKLFAVGGAGALPLPFDALVEELASGQAPFEFRAKLLRAY